MTERREIAVPAQRSVVKDRVAVAVLLSPNGAGSATMSALHKCVAFLFCSSDGWLAVCQGPPQDYRMPNAS